MERFLAVVDDEQEIGAYIADFAETMQYTVRVFDQPGEFVSGYQSLRPSVIFLDLQMPGRDGVEVLRHLGRLNCKSKIILMSGIDSRTLATAAKLGESFGLDIHDSLSKPIRLQDLQRTLGRLAERTALGEADIEAALSNEQFTLMFQPKISLRAAEMLRISGLEALVRWQHPERGLISPGEFIPMAEQTPLIEPLTKSVVARAARRIKQWRDAGQELTVAVNLSGKLLDDLTLPEQFEEIVEQAGTKPSAIVFEVTETAAMENIAISMEVLTRLRLKGFGLSIDDFGTGFSSLVQLYRLPFSELKIDRSLVADIGINPEAETVVRSIVGLGRNLGLGVCAEGVETPESLEFLKDVGCDSAQGYYFSRPVPDAEIQALLENAPFWQGASPTVSTAAFT